MQLGFVLFDRLNLSLECSYAIENCTKNKWFSIELLRSCGTCFVASPGSRKDSENPSMVSILAGKEMVVCPGWLSSGESLGGHL